MTPRLMNYESVLKMLEATRFDSIRATLFFQNDLEESDSVLEMPVRADLMVGDGDFRAEICRRDDYKIIVLPERLIGSEVALEEHDPHEGSLREEFWHETLDTSVALPLWKQHLFPLSSDPGQPMIEIAGLIDGLVPLGPSDDSVKAALGTFTGDTGSIAEVPTSEISISNKLAYALISELAWFNASYEELLLGNHVIKKFNGEVFFRNLGLTRRYVSLTMHVRGDCEEFEEHRGNEAPIVLRKDSFGNKVKVDLEFSATIRVDLPEGTIDWEEWEKRQERIEVIFGRANFLAADGTLTYRGPQISSDPIVARGSGISYSTEDVRISYILFPLHPDKQRFTAMGLANAWSSDAEVSKAVFAFGNGSSFRPRTAMRGKDLSLEMEIDYAAKLNNGFHEETDRTRGTFSLPQLGIEADFEHSGLSLDRASGTLEIAHGSFGPNHFRLDFCLDGASVEAYRMSLGNTTVLGTEQARLDMAGNLRLEIWEPGTIALHADYLHVIADTGSAEVSLPSITDGLGNPVALSLRLEGGLRIGIRDFLSHGFWESEDAYVERLSAGEVKADIRNAIATSGPIDLTFSVADFSGAGNQGSTTIKNTSLGRMEGLSLKGYLLTDHVHGTIDIERAEFQFSVTEDLAIPKIENLTGLFPLDTTGNHEALAVEIPVPDGPIVASSVGFRKGFGTVTINLDGPKIEVSDSLDPATPNLVRVDFLADSVSPGIAAQFRSKVAKLRLPDSDPQEIKNLQFDLYGRSYAQHLANDWRTLLSRILIRIALHKPLVEIGSKFLPQDVDLEFCEVAMPIIDEIGRKDPEALLNPYVLAMVGYCELQELKKKAPWIDWLQVGLVIDEFGARIWPLEVEIKDIYQPFISKDRFAVILSGGIDKVGGYIQYHLGVGPFSIGDPKEEPIPVDLPDLPTDIIVEFAVKSDSQSQITLEVRDYYKLYMGNPVSLKEMLDIGASITGQSINSEGNVDLAKKIVHGVFGVAEIQSQIERNMQNPLGPDFLKSWNAHQPKLTVEPERNRVTVSTDAEQNTWNAL